MLVSIFPCKKETEDSFYVEARRTGDRIRIELDYHGMNCRLISATFEIPDDAVIRTYHTSNADEVSLTPPGKDGQYLSISVFNGINYVPPATGRKIFEKLLNEIKSALVPREYLKELGEQLLEELKKKKNVDEETLRRLEQYLSVVGAK